MRAVSDTSPISNLAAIGHLVLLQQQFTEIRVPPAVEKELMVHPEPSVLADLEQFLRQPLVHRAAPSNSGLLNVLLLSLHPGEAEAIALATELRTDLILLDEKEGREVAAQAGLAITGVLGILLRAKQDGHISALKPELQSLRQKARFFLSAAMETKVLSIAGE